MGEQRILAQGDMVESFSSRSREQGPFPEFRAIPSRAFWSYLRFFLYLFYYFEAGLFLTIAPWSEGWEQNLWIWYSPGLAEVLRSGYLRGGLSAVGIMHLAWGVLEALEAARAAGRRSAGAR